MADNKGSEQLEKKVETPAPDPIADRSMSGPLLISSLLLVVTLIWSLYDEVLGQRPWKGYQRDFVDSYTTYLNQIKPNQAKAEQEVKESFEYQQLNQAVQAAEQDVRPRLGEITARVAQIDVQLKDITEPFQNARAWLAAKNFELETTTSEGGKNRIRKSIDERKEELIEFKWHTDEGREEERELSYTNLEALYNDLRNEKARLLSERIKLEEPVNVARKKRDDLLQNRLTGLTEQQVQGLVVKMDNFKYDIRQINVANGAVVDRCESCHLGTREPVTLTKEAMGGKAAFVSHPNPDLLKIHDPERFGCSTCHGGNGRGTTSMEKAHGRYKHWLWPLYYKENTQAGCNQCHNRDRVIQGANVLNDGKDLFQERGCVGCHRYEGFDREADALSSSRQSIKTLEMQRDARSKEIAQTLKESDDPNKSVEEARALLKRVEALRQMVSEIDARIDETDAQSKYLLQDQKKVGPNLKEIKAKLRRDWIPDWLRDPQAFRPGTKMPSFRLNDDEVKAVSAFLWQSSLDMKVASQPAGDANRGKQLFKTIGCLGCHSIDGRAIDMGDQVIGGDFAANLSRVGEKANYDYIVRWVHNPRERLAPYSPSLKRDLTPDDYAKKGLPFLFDDQHSRSPVDGRELQVQNMTVMPNFRLSDQDARDIATFLMSRKRIEPNYPDASFMDDSSLFAQGKQLVSNYGCAGCHEIKGLEDEQRIGTELTLEGSKPIERLDFALLTHDAMKGEDPITRTEVERGKWYDHKGFFENKLKDPDVYERGKERVGDSILRMPNIYLKRDDVTALTTFLLGSVETALPASMRYNPVGQQKQVQDGWWVIKKYNCMGCHNIMPGQDSALMRQPMYEGEGKEQLPPRLTNEGARVQPDWLLRFLDDPSLSTESERGRQQAGGASGGRQQAPAQQMSAPRLMAHLQGGAAASAQPQPGQQAQPGSQSQQVPGLRPQPGANRNGVRQYLQVRMPTFNFSPSELQALVNFFMGESAQHLPYIPEQLDPLTADEQGMARALFSSVAAPCLKCHMTGDPAHDSRATAPNFLLAPERLKPAWTRRWLVDPNLISPGTSMPSELFRVDDQHDGRWVFNGATPPSFNNYEKDHVDLLVRYMFQITGEEQRRIGGGGTVPASTGAANVTSSISSNRPRKPDAFRQGFAAVRSP